MRTAGTFGGGGGFPPVPRGTRVLIGLLAGLSILAAVLGPWAGIVSLAELLHYNGDDVVRGQVWRLVTYPWITGEPLGLIFGVLMFVFFAGPLELDWGRRLFFRRVAILVVAPMAVLALLGLLLPAVGQVAALGPTSLTLALITAFAAQLRNRTIMLFPIPIRLTGDMILWFEGALLGLYVLFGGGILRLLPQIFTFALALGWFRFDLARDLRRAWLNLKKRRLEAKMQRLRKSRNLKVVRDDDEDDSKRYLH